MAKGITYNGDQTATFNPKTGGGTVGRVLGMRGRWFIVTSATYDAQLNKTQCVIEQVVNPDVALAAALSEEWHED